MAEHAKGCYCTDCQFGIVQEEEPAAQPISNIADAPLPPPYPSCPICGGKTEPDGFKCLSCGASTPSAPDAPRDYWPDYQTAVTELASAERELEKLREALRAIAIALAEPAGGEYWTARELADKWGIYSEDLEGTRVLLRLAEAALGEKGSE